MESISKYINRIARCSVLYRSVRLTPLGLNGHQHSYILLICQKPGLSQEELANQIYVNKSSVTRQLVALEKAGFITRKPAFHDRRCLRVYPTDKAFQTLPVIEQVLQDWNDLLCRGFSGNQKTELTRVLQLLMERSDLEIQSLKSAAEQSPAAH
ncbi:MarR family transcriptional regulator [Oscillospiraceae bacterium HV4-5-C5C]|nr:MarR family transcriptional regulator [Oscillospiraceae bacterium HV4-5-C5C]